MGPFDPIARCIPQLRRYARALLAGRGEADDLVQDTLERAWSRLDQLRPGSEPRVWLFSILHNLFVDQARAGSSRRTEPLDGAAPERATPSSERDVLQLGRLSAAIAQLPAAQREVLLLVGLEGLTYDEAARALDVPPGTIMSRLSRAREAVRASMEESPPRRSLRVIE